MEILANIVVLIFSLNIEGLGLLLVSFITILFAVMCLLSFLNKESIAEHFDKYTIQYITILCLIVQIIIFIMLYKISFMLFAVALALIPAILHIIAQFNQPTYDYDGVENDNSFIRKLLRQREGRIKRRVSLNKAESFIKPYTELMGKQTLSNQYCQLTYNPENIPRFNCFSKKQNKKGEFYMFTAFIDNDINWNNDFFNSICLNFSYNTNLETLHALFKKSDFVFTNSNYQSPNINLPKKNQVDLTDKAKTKQKEILLKHKKAINHLPEITRIDVNYATEADFTALPGINIVQAKKIIKYRNINGDFNSVDDFIAYIKVKPHFEALIRPKIYATPTIIKLNLKKLNSDERIIDLD